MNTEHREADSSAQELILVVEDNEDLNHAICVILQSYKYRILSAFDGAEALKLMDSTLPDIILCDIMMPGMDGYGLLQHTRANERLRMVPFIFLTALTSTEDQRKALRIGIEDYLTKPVDENDLVLAIQNAIRRRRDTDAEIENALTNLRNQIVGTLQHEFRTPLTFVLGYAEYLQDITEQKIDTYELRTATSGILEGGYRLQKLIESFLRLAEIQGVQIKVDDLQVIKGQTLLQNVAQELGSRLEDANLTVQISLENSDAHLIGEPELLHEALKRLLDNTVQYPRPESQKIWLSVQCLTGGHIGLRVRDEGQGIPPETVAALTQPFEQGDRSERTQPGAGLSLALIQHIAHMHNGKLEIESTVGVGTTITLWLPAAPTP